VNGEPEQVDEVRAKEILSAEDLEVRVDINLGSESAKYWTCDFSYVSPSASKCHDVRIVDGVWYIQEYVRINGDYRS